MQNYEQQLQLACEKFRKVLEGQLQRVEMMKSQGDELWIENFADAVAEQSEATLVNKTTGATATLQLSFSARQREILLAGGMLNYTKK